MWPLTHAPPVLGVRPMATELKYFGRHLIGWHPVPTTSSRRTFCPPFGVGFFLGTRRAGHLRERRRHRPPKKSHITSFATIALDVGSLPRVFTPPGHECAPRSVTHNFTRVPSAQPA
jgi:hypothetical protein